MAGVHNENDFKMLTRVAERTVKSLAFGRARGRTGSAGINRHGAWDGRSPRLLTSFGTHLNATSYKTLCMRGNSMVEDREISMASVRKSIVRAVGEGLWPQERHVRRG